MRPASSPKIGPVPGQTKPAPRRDRRGHDPEERHRRNREAEQVAYQAARVVLDRAAARRDAGWKAAAEANRRRVLLLLALPGALGLAVMGIGFAYLPLLVVGAVLVIVWAITASLTWTRSASSLLAQLGGSAPSAAAAAGYVSSLGAERLSDLTEGLCAVLGLPVPELRVLDDRAPNAIAVGRKHHDAAIVVTAGLLELLDRIELEGVLAHELAHVKQLDVASATIGASSVGHMLLAVGGARGASWMEGPDREIRADVAGASTTRYPPGMISALEKLAAIGDCRPSSVPPDVLARTSASWLIRFGTHGDDSAIPVRLDVLREL